MDLTLDPEITNVPNVPNVPIVTDVPLIPNIPNVPQLESNAHFQAIIDLLNHISNDKEKTNDKLFIISAAYDKVYKKFNDLSLIHI